MQDRLDAGNAGRAGAHSSLRLLVLLGALVLLPLAYHWLAEGAGHTLVERLLGQSPQARLEEYLAAVGRGDRQAAMGGWRARAGRVVGGDVRRQTVTLELLSLGPGLRHRLAEVQWWNNWCCEPGVARDPATANVAFMRVEVTDRAGQVRTYVFEARAHAILGHEPPGSAPVRGWELGDVFRGDGRALDADGPPPLWSFHPQRTLRWEEYDESTWVTFRDEGWPLALRHPQAWNVTVEEDVSGRRVLVRARDRSLTIHRRGGMPADLPPEWSKVQIGPLPARKHVRRDVDGMLREVVVVPGQASEWPSAVSYALAGLREDEEYMRLFDALLGTAQFGPQAALSGTR